MISAYISPETRDRMRSAARDAFVARWGAEPRLVTEPERLPGNRDVYGDYIWVSVTARESIEWNRRGPRVHVTSFVDSRSGTLVEGLSFDYHDSVIADAAR